MSIGLRDVMNCLMSLVVVVLVLWLGVVGNYLLVRVQVRMLCLRWLE